MTLQSAVYEERYRLTWLVAGAAVADGGFVALALVFPLPLALRVLTIGVFGWFAVATVAAVLTRRVAFRADAAGLTLGGSPLRYRSTTRVFPWPEVDAVTVWTRDVLFAGPGRIKSRLLLRYVGVRRPAGSAPLPGRLANVRAGAFAPGGAGAPPGVLAGTARVVSGWRLDDSRLAAAISAFAPSVELTILH